MNEVTEQDYLESLDQLEEPADNSSLEAPTNIVSMKGWEDLLHTTEKGAITRGAYNISLILHNDPEFKGLFKYDTRRNQVILSRNAYHNEAGVNLGSVPMNVASRIDEKYHINISLQTISEHIESEAITYYKFDPVKDLFNTAYAKWDGKKRMETLFIDYLGVKDTPISRKITRVFFDGLVHKVMNPFTKFDRVLDLVGDQGIGKTRIFEILGGEYYTDNISTLTDKDDKIEMSRNLIVNDDEMAVTNKMSFEDLKKFVSETSLTFRKPYGRNSVTVGKGFVIVRSTNNIEYLKDKTGNRRFMTLVVDKENRKKNIKDFTRAEAMQVLGEAAHEFVIHENITEDEGLTPEMLAEAQKDSHYSTEVENIIVDWLDNNPETDLVTVKFLAEDVLDINNAANSPKLTRQIKYIMDHLDGWKYGRFGSADSSRPRGYKRV